MRPNFIPIPVTNVFAKLYTIGKKEIPFVHLIVSMSYIFSTKEKILVDVESMLFDSFDHELKYTTLTKKFFFNKTNKKRIKICYESILDVEELTEDDHKKYSEKFGIDTKMSLRCQFEVK